jgi:anti-sigma B factor antagonist
MVNEQQLLIDVSRSGQDLARVRLIGEMDMSEEQRFADVVTNGVIADKPATVELDLSELRFMDSSGLRALLQARNTAEDLGVRLVLDDPQPTIRKVLEITLTADRFEIRTTDE